MKSVRFVIPFAFGVLSYLPQKDPGGTGGIASHAKGLPTGLALPKRLREGDVGKHPCGIGTGLGQAGPYIFHLLSLN